VSIASKYIFWKMLVNNQNLLGKQTLIFH